MRKGRLAKRVGNFQPWPRGIRTAPSERTLSPLTVTVAIEPTADRGGVAAALLLAPDEGLLDCFPTAV
jgi:hypothetical protein